MRDRRRFTVTAAFIVAVIGSGGLFTWLIGDKMTPLNMIELTGDWVRKEGENCDARFPSSLQLHSDGTYLAPGAVDEGALFHGGDWELSDGTMRIQAANDAMLSYSVEISNAGQLVIKDAQNCQITYLKGGR